jgi:hypothetical protein
MTDLNYFFEISKLSATAMLGFAVVYLHRRSESQAIEIKMLNEEIKKLLKDMGKLEGKVAVEIAIDQKLNSIISFFEKQQTNTTYRRKTQKTPSNL